jgi:hypothetical protein
MKKSFGWAVIGLAALFPFAAHAGGRFDGQYTTHLACEAHGETPAYKFVFPSEVKDSVFHGQHSQEGERGYLVIDGKINDDGTAKLEAKGEIPHGYAHGVITGMKGGNYSYKINAQFGDQKGTGQRDAGVGFFGRDCTFEFDKLPTGAPPAADTGDRSDRPAAPSGDATQKQN